MNSKTAICIFTKSPVPGKVKTRLTPHFSAKKAAKLAEAFFQDTWAVVRNLSWAHVVAVIPEKKSEEASPNIDGEVWWLGQGDLGSRLELASKKALVEQKANGVILIGSDTPGLPERFLIQTQEALEKADAVIGPAEDGGFYLLAFKEFQEGLFKNISWSRKTTYEQMLDRLKKMNLNVFILEKWFDVDRPEDLQRLEGLIKRDEIRALKTRKILLQLRPK